MRKTPGSIGFLSWPAFRLPGLAAFLEAKPRFLFFSAMAGGVEKIAGWGRRAHTARKLAARKGLPFLTLEDGFLRSVERHHSRLSLVVDDLGIYYDASQPSRLEKLIAKLLNKTQKARVRALIKAWRKARVSKYNYSRDYEGKLPSRYVLVVDQNYRDFSVLYGRGNKESFARMLDAALSENPDCTIIVKLHPDTFTRRKRSHFDVPSLMQNPRIKVLVEDCHPIRLIEKAQAVYAVTSQVGFDALMWGKKVRIFGMPFYAGWGLTEDELPAPHRRGRASLEQLVHAALIDYPRYIDPETGKRCEVEALLAHIGLQRRMRERFSHKITAVGFSLWKRPILGRFLGGSNVHFHHNVLSIPRQATVAIWGNEASEGLAPEANLLCIEDGFLRSVGLGADLIEPLSWICDDLGIYYDASKPSRLERILAETDFDKALLVQARALRKRILEAGITKYNIKAPPWKRPASSQKVMLVPGQVETDASIRFGAPGIKTNLDLLRAVRRANPKAYIIYKPHPDVQAGLRTQGKSEKLVELHCDEILGNASMANLLNAVDEVATLTSLTGFEALMRGKRVTCYGQPFYAGWGLTKDIIPIPRRTRQLSLDELVAGALILYPVYVSRATGRFTSPERTVEELITWRETGDSLLVWWQRILRPVFANFKRHIRKLVLERKVLFSVDKEDLHGGS
ncbi:MAG: hypothetical protein V3R64_00790 [Sphingomonadales bacterium]